jgi:hypothetical protein
MAAVKFNLTAASSFRVVSAQGTNPQHAVEMLDTVVVSGSPIYDARFFWAQIGAARLTALRAISPQET